MFEKLIRSSTHTGMYRLFRIPDLPVRFLPRSQARTTKKSGNESNVHTGLFVLFVCFNHSAFALTRVWQYPIPSPLRIAG